MVGCSTGCPASMDQASLTYWAWLQASGVVHGAPSAAASNAGAIWCSSRVHQASGTRGALVPHVVEAEDPPTASRCSCFDLSVERPRCFFLVDLAYPGKVYFGLAVVGE